MKSTILSIALAGVTALSGVGFTATAAAAAPIPAVQTATAVKTSASGTGYVQWRYRQPSLFVGNFKSTGPGVPQHTLTIKRMSSTGKVTTVAQFTVRGNTEIRNTTRGIRGGDLAAVETSWPSSPRTPRIISGYIVGGARKASGPTTNGSAWD